METPIEVKIRIARIQETRFSINEKISTLSDIKFDSVDIRLGYNLNCDIANNQFTINIKIDYFSKIESSTLVSLDVANTFEIQDMSSHFVQRENEFDDKSNVVPQMLRLSIGSTRGVLAAKVVGTALANMPLPMFNVSALLEQKTKRQ
ncbi:MAG: hypothetical protein SNH27_17510 [Rikenellaceae bacterium]